MAADLAPATLRRLAFIRYLFDRGVEQTRLAEPLGAAGLLMIHDSVELFLYLASEQLGAEPSGTFGGYFPKLNEMLSPRELVGTTPLITLNKARVSLKHYGTHPSTLDLDAFRTSSDAFFIGNTPLVFGCAFAEVSLAQLVLDAPVRAALQEADAHERNNELREAAESIALAFGRLLNLYGISSYAERPHSVPTHGADAMSHIAARIIEKQSRTINVVAFEVGLLRFGIDTRRFAVFRKLTPNVPITMAGSHSFYWSHPIPAYTTEHIRFCYDFVVRAALQVQSVSWLGGLLTARDRDNLQRGIIPAASPDMESGAAPTSDAPGLSP